MRQLNRILFLAVLLFPASCLAAEVTFQTSPTFGCFTTTNCNPTSSIALIGGGNNPPTLAFAGSAFGPATSIGGNLDVSLGTFTLSGAQAPFNLNPYSFVARVTFTLPTGLSQQTYTADVMGQIVEDNNMGGAWINFSNTPQTFTFSLGNGATGSFDFYVDDVWLLTPDITGPMGPVQQWNGHITNARQPITTAVPEPASLLIMGSALSAFGYFRRRKSRKQ